MDKFDELVAPAYYPGLTVRKLRDAMWAFLREQGRNWGVQEGRAQPVQLERGEWVFDVKDGTLWGIIRKAANIEEAQPYPHGLIKTRFREAVKEWCDKEVLLELDERGTYTFTPEGYERIRSGAGWSDSLHAGNGEIVARFRREFGTVEGAPLLIRYLGQAEQAVEHEMDLAAAVMIGACYELALLQVTDALVARWKNGVVPNLDGKLQSVLKSHQDAAINKTRGPQALDLLKATHAALDALSRVKPSLVASQKDWIQTSFAVTFNDVREARNDAGHPGGDVPDLELLAQHVTRFCSDYKRVREIIDALK